jgi:hypothetical protein
MNPFSAEYNKKNNMFEQGISRIRNKNNNFFENTRLIKSIYNLADIKSYFVVTPTPAGPVLQFRKNNPLPAAIEKDITTLFNSIWPTVPAAE